MDRLTFRQIEHYFYHYPKYLRELEELKEESLSVGYQTARSDIVGGFIGGKVPPGAPFEDNVIEKLARILALENLTESILRFYESLDKEKQKIFRLKYVRGYSNSRVIRDVPISRSGFYSKRKEIVEAYYNMLMAEKEKNAGK